MKTGSNQSVELFQAFAVEELESRLQNVYYGFGDEYYGCCWYGNS